MTKSGQAREHVFYAELAGQTAKARLEARLAKEELTRLMGLWGTDIDYQIPNRLAQLPKGLIKRDKIEAEALQRRVDLHRAGIRDSPIFDSGKARMRKSELAYMRAANQLAEKAVNVRSEARSAYEAYRSNYDIARHYRNSVVPFEPRSRKSRSSPTTA
jgi:outer membrane protein TolC